MSDEETQAHPRGDPESDGFPQPPPHRYPQPYSHHSLACPSRRAPLPRIQHINRHVNKSPELAGGRHFLEERVQGAHIRGSTVRILCSCVPIGFLEVMSTCTILVGPRSALTRDSELAQGNGNARTRWSGMMCINLCHSEGTTTAQFASSTHRPGRLLSCPGDASLQNPVPHRQSETSRGKMEYLPTSVCAK